MGWKGFVRSVGASSRRAARASERHQRAVSRAHSKADNLLSRLDAEVEKEIARISEWEQKLSEAPIKALKLGYEPGTGWSTKPLEDKTGIVTYSLKVTPSTLDAALFDPAVAELGKVELTPLAVALCSYYTAVAFRVSAAGDAARTLKLVNRASPEASRIALADPSGETYLPTDTSLDGRIFGGTAKVGVVTFEAFGEGVEHFDLLLVADGEDDAPVRIRVSAGEDLRAGIDEALKAPGVLDEFVKQLRETQAGAHAQVQEQKRKAASGCAILLMSGLGLTGLALALLLGLPIRH